MAENFTNNELISWCRSIARLERPSTPEDHMAEAVADRLQSLSAERSALITALEQIATGYSKGLKHYEHILVVQEIAKEALEKVSGKP